MSEPRPVTFGYVPPETICQRYHISPRELDVIRLLAEDLTNKQIANRLGIAENTVKVYIKSLTHLLNVRSRVGVLMWGIRVGLVKP